jgi:thiosulfate/3-mercaptopyruvate sulfurtransferase
MPPRAWRKSCSTRVKDVRILDGGWKTWFDAGLPVERGLPKDVAPAPDFGVTIPAQPQLMLDMEQARGLLHRRMRRW